ncbi:MAG: hypothetical protein JSV80_06735, partial [Acidobacteriota bacterium]
MLRSATARLVSLLIVTPLLFVLAPATRAGEPAAGPTPAEPHRLRVRVQADASERDRIAARGLDIAGHALEEDALELIATPDELDWLRTEGFRLEVIEIRERPRPLAQGSHAESGDRDEPVIDAPLADDRYHDPDEVEAFLQQVAADHPSITRLVELGRSTEDRPIWALMISDNAASDEDELTVLFNGAHHAREVMTPEVVMDTIDVLTDGYGIDPDVTRWVDSYAIWCVPIVNPDGVAVVHEEDDFWRKNTRDNNSNGLFRDSQDGVDLNRNYEWGWGYQCQGSSGSFSSATYRGPSEGSEPEAKALTELGRRIRPVFDVEYHSYGEDVFYALSCDPQFSPTLETITSGPDQQISRVIAEQYSSRIVQADGQLGYSAAPYGSRVDGTGRDQQYHENGAIAFVTEINNSAEGGFHPDYGVYRDATVEGQRPGWQYLLDRVSGPAVGGRVTDAVTGLPLEADVALDEMHLPDGKRLSSRADTGRFHIIVVEGSYTLRVTAAGYQSAVVPVTVGASWLPTSVALVPDGASRIAADDFEDPATVAQWTAGFPGDTATGGQWEWGEPQGTHQGTVQSSLLFGNARFDRTPGEGKNAFVTGNGAGGADFTGDDVDGGKTTLVSPSYDLSAFYAVTLHWQRWFRKEIGDPIDRFEVEASIDGGQSWIVLDQLLDPTATADAAPVWLPASVALDSLIPLGADMRFRFVVFDEATESTVEGAIDDLALYGYGLASDGRVGGVSVSDGASTVVSWDPVPGGAGAVYDVVRGDL